MTANHFQHHEADEAPTSPGRPFGGTSEGAALDPAAERILACLAARLGWRSLAEFLGPHRLLVGKELSGRRIATIACADGRSYDVYPNDTDSEDVTARHLHEVVWNASENAKMLQVERFLRGWHCWCGGIARSHE